MFFPNVCHGENDDLFDDRIAVDCKGRARVGVKGSNAVRCSKCVAADNPMAIVRSLEVIDDDGVCGESDGISRQRTCEKWQDRFV